MLLNSHLFERGFCFLFCLLGSWGKVGKMKLGTAVSYFSNLDYFGIWEGFWREKVAKRNKLGQAVCLQPGIRPLKVMAKRSQRFQSLYLPHPGHSDWSLLTWSDSKGYQWGKRGQIRNSPQLVVCSSQTEFQNKHRLYYLMILLPNS